MSQAISEALSKTTEQERIVAILDCVKGYRNEYDMNEEKAQFDGFMKCKNEYRNQMKRLKSSLIGTTSKVCQRN